MTVSFHAISITHEHAPVHIREKFYLTDSEVRTLLQSLQDLLGISEVFVLSTCNRTEVYYLSEQVLSDEILSLLAKQKGYFEPIATLFPYFQIFDSTYESLEHLFSVAAGMKSAILGDLQIIHQVKQAYILANEMQSAGPFLHRMFHQIFHLNKRIQNETGLKEGSASLAYAAAEAIFQHASNIPNPHLLIIGLGDMGKNTCINLVKNFGFTNITLANRTPEKALALANELNLNNLPLDLALQQISSFELLLTAINTPEPLITPDLLRPHPNLCMAVDLSVPRAIHQDLDTLQNLTILNVDTLQIIVQNAIEQRKNHLPKAKLIVKEEVLSLLEWSNELSISPIIQQMKQALEQIRKEELARYFNKMDEQSQKWAEQITQNMINKILKYPVLQIKAACKRGEQETLLQVLKDLFTIQEKQKV